MGMGGYALYKIETKAKGIPEMEDGNIYSVWRRFKEFKNFHQYLLD